MNFNKALEAANNIKGFTVDKYDLIYVLKALASPAEECEHEIKISNKCKIYGCGELATKPDPLREVYEKYKYEDRDKMSLDRFTKHCDDMWQAIKAWNTLSQ